MKKSSKKIPRVTRRWGLYSNRGMLLAIFWTKAEALDQMFFEPKAYVLPVCVVPELSKKQNPKQSFKTKSPEQVARLMEADIGVPITIVKRRNE